MSTKYIKLAMWVILTCLVIATPARAAYIDPNTGGMLFQVLAILFGVLSGLILLFSSKIRMAFYRIARFVRGLRTPRESDTESKG